MKKQLLTLLLAAASVGGVMAQPTQEKAATESIMPAQVTLLYPLGTSGRNSVNQTYYLSLNVLVGKVGGIKGAEFGWIGNINYGSLMGIQGAGVFNITRGPITGVQHAGIFNMAGGQMTGVQAAGIFNMTGGQVKGVQAAGIFNMTGGQVTGVQAAGIVNLTGGQVTGVQAAGIGNHTGGSLSGIQAAGIYNYATSSHESLQAAGIVNLSLKGSGVQMAGITNLVASEGVKFQAAGIANLSKGTANVQIAGVANLADTAYCQIGVVNVVRARSFQLGLVNVRDSADGVMLGLVNIVKQKEGRVLELEVAGGEFINAMVSFRSGTRKLYGIIGMGGSFRDDFISSAAGLGTSVTLGQRAALNFELIQHNLFAHYDRDSKRFRGHSDYLNMLSQVRILAEVKLANHLKLFAGPVLNYYIARNTEANSLLTSAPYSIWNRDGRFRQEAWVGFSAGLRF